jgi:hypothetical protein
VNPCEECDGTCTVCEPSLPTIKIVARDGRYFAKFFVEEFGHQVEVAGDSQDEAMENAWEYLEEIDAEHRQIDRLIRESVSHLKKARSYIDLEIERLENSQRKN